MQYQLVMGQLLNLQYSILIYLNIQIQKFSCLSRGKTLFDVENRQSEEWTILISQFWCIVLATVSHSLVKACIKVGKKPIKFYALVSRSFLLAVCVVWNMVSSCCCPEYERSAALLVGPVTYTNLEWATFQYLPSRGRGKMFHKELGVGWGSILKSSAQSSKSPLLKSHLFKTHLKTSKFLLHHLLASEHLLTWIL